MNGTTRFTEIVEPANPNPCRVRVVAAMEASSQLLLLPVKLRARLPGLPAPESLVSPSSPTRQVLDSGHTSGSPCSWKLSGLLK